ncbi:hypothetical protein EV401DRAFT_1929687 [Pisolithus croceorrhizus]|nr:hypothetical protein EV401DRAFT_1929687 [Pisolithus croceorrhizus]
MVRPTPTVQNTRHSQWRWSQLVILLSCLAIPGFREYRGPISVYYGTRWMEGYGTVYIEVSLVGTVGKIEN